VPTRWRKLLAGKKKRVPFHKRHNGFKVRNVPKREREKEIDSTVSAYDLVLSLLSNLLGLFPLVLVPPLSLGLEGSLARTPCGGRLSTILDRMANQLSLDRGRGMHERRLWRLIGKTKKKSKFDTVPWPGTVLSVNFELFFSLT
jgi:hypothetical protein